MAQSFAWRLFPVLTLTIRQFLGGKAVRVVTVLSFVPCLFAAIYLINPSVNSPRAFLIDVIFLNLVAPTLLPIAVLILATGALGNEVEDRTLPYLTLKPIGRLRIVLEKLGGVLVVAVPAVLAGLAVTYGMVYLLAGDELVREGRRVVEARTVLPPVLWAMLGAGAVGVVGFATLFMTVSLIIPRALLSGIVYSFAWESLLGRFLPGVRIVSVRHYVQSVFVALLDDPDVTIDNANSLRSSLITLGIACLIAIALATWRLRRMNLE